MELSDAKLRVWYLSEILVRLRTNEVFSPTAAQESSYKEVLAHVVRIISNESNASLRGTCRGMKACTKFQKKKQSRKEGLKEVLEVLHAMERKRIYDPPGETEIGYYLIIRKYIRSLLTFFGSEIQPAFHRHSNCFPMISELHYLDELAELCRHFANFSASVSQMDRRNSYTPLMGIKYSHEAPPIIPGSKERNSAFYYHKFILALFDLRSHSALFFSPPSAEELISYLKVLDCTLPPPAKSEVHLVMFSEEADVYSDYLRYLLIERMRIEINDLEIHCMSIIHAIVRKLSPSEPWDALFKSCYKDRETVEEGSIVGDLVDKCKVSVTDIPDYIIDVERSIRVAYQMEYFLSGYCIDSFDRCSVLDCLERPFKNVRSNLFSLICGWGILHALTLLNPGSRDQFEELSILNNPMVQDPSERKIGATERLVQDENVNNLQGVIDDLECIGDSDVVPDKEETQLLQKIWQSVASAVKFFICALAYEQQQCVIKGNSLSADTVDFINSVTRHGLRTANERKNDYMSLWKLESKIIDLRGDFTQLHEILNAYKEGLLEKLQMTGESSHAYS